MGACRLNRGRNHSLVWLDNVRPTQHPAAMNTKLCILALSLCLSARCDAQESEPSAATSLFFAKMRQGEQEDHKLRELAAERDKSVATLRVDLAKPWTSLIIALRKDCSCSGRFRGFCIGQAGTTYSGFCLRRDGESVTVAPWIEREGKEQTGKSRPMTQPEVERLLSETALFYLAAMLSEAPLEKAGPKPGDPAKVEEWSQRYSAAGGRPFGSGGDNFWIEVRVATPGGLKRHSDMWGRYCPSNFLEWITAFETLPPR